jgi:3',5'-cyclic AMP phosphodiesterase CpdA
MSRDGNTSTSERAVTIAHLSDVHLGPITGFSARYWNAKRATGYINWHRNRRDAYRRDVLDRIVADMKAQQPDHIAVTGDLCNIGLPAEMDAAKAWLETVGAPDRVSVIPGNHDIYTTIGRDPGIMRWAAYMTGDPDFDVEMPPIVERRAQVRMPFPYVRRIGHIALIGLNTAIETPPLVAAGQLGADQRSRLAVTLDQAAASGLFRLVMLHHPPLPGQTRRSHALNDAAALRDLLAEHGAELVIHGHLHVNVRASLAQRGGAGMIPIIGAPSGSLGVRHAHEPLARYNLLTIRDHRITVVGRGLADPDGDITELERYDVGDTTEAVMGNRHAAS